MNNAKVAEWLREAADDIEQEIAPLLGRVLSGPYTKKIRERASQVEAMTCDGCRWWVGYGHDLSPIWECGKYTDEGDRDFIRIETCGPKFGCIHWEEKK